MKNKFLLMIVAVAVLFSTACVKNEVSDEVKKLREEQLNLAKANTEIKQAKATLDKATAALKELEAKRASALYDSKIAYAADSVKKELLKLQLEIKNAQESLDNDNLTDAADYAAKYAVALDSVDLYRDKINDKKKIHADKKGQLAMLKANVDLEKILQYDLEREKDTLVIAQAKLALEEAALAKMEELNEHKDSVKVKEEIAKLEAEKANLQNAKEKKDGEVNAMADAIKRLKSDDPLNPGEKEKLDEKYIDPVDTDSASLKTKLASLATKMKKKDEAQMKFDAKVADSTTYATAVDWATTLATYNSADSVVTAKEFAKDVVLASKAKLRQEMTNAGMKTAAGEIPELDDYTDPLDPNYPDPTDPDFADVDWIFFPAAPAENLTAEVKPWRIKWNNKVKALAVAQKALDAATKAKNDIQPIYNLANPKITAFDNEINDPNTGLRKKLQDAIDEVETLNTEIAEITARLDQNKDKYTEAKARIEEIEAEVFVKKFEKKDLEIEQRLLELDINAKDNQINVWKNILANITDYGKVIADQIKAVEDAKIDVENAKKDIQVAQESAPTKEAYIAKMEAEIAALEAEVAQLEAKKAAWQAQADAWKAKLDAALTAAGA